MYSEGLTVRIPKGHKLPTISVDNSNKCDFYLNDTSAVSGGYDNTCIMECVANVL